MHDYMLFMHDDAKDTPQADTDAAWSSYIESLTQSGRFLGGSALGGGKSFTQSGAAGEISTQITGYIRVQADSLDDARLFLKGNPVFEAGGTVEIRELTLS